MTSCSTPHCQDSLGQKLATVPVQGPPGVVPGSAEVSSLLLRRQVMLSWTTAALSFPPFSLWPQISVSYICLPLCHICHFSTDDQVRCSLLTGPLSLSISLLQVHVNPKYIVLESDFTNNVVRCNIHYTGRYVSTTNCKIVQYVFAQPLTPTPTTFLPEEQAGPP